MPPVETSRIVVDASASKLAFQAGQVLERLLLERAVASARSSRLEVVTPDLIESLLREVQVADLKVQRHERIERSDRAAA